MKKIVMLALASLTIGTAAQADVGIDIRQANQQRQIDAGKRSGKLSLSERRTLTNEQRAIKRQEARYRDSRPGFTNREQGLIMAMLDRSQAHIDRLKNNRTRGPNDVPKPF
jgi:predicted RNA-binding protein with RPS1 domain